MSSKDSNSKAVPVQTEGSKERSESPQVSRGRNRNSRRAYEFSQRNVDWGESREYEEREGSKKGKPTARSQGHKAKRQQESRAKYLNRPDTDLKDYGAMTDASRETDAKDELDWEIGMLSASTPINATYCQNFDFSGFFTLIEQTYSSMLEVNPRIIKEMPFSVFQHSMVSKLNAVLLDRIKESSQNTNLTEQYAQDLWPDDTLIPQPILDYFSYIANTVCSTGESVVVNIPELAIPQGPIKVDDVEVCPSGSFGYVNANTHNVYECYASPLVTSRMVINEFRVAGQPELPPLPPYIAPAEPSTSSSTPPAGLITRYGRRVRFPARLLSVVTGEGDLWPDDTLIPQPILDYFSYIANTVCSTGESVVVNIPELAIPQGPIKVDDVEVCPSGSFGYVNANTHNVYECYASPLVTSRMVINEFRVAGQPELPPLPPYIAPAEPSTSSSTPPAGLITRYGRRVRFPARLLSVVTGEGRNVDWGESREYEEREGSKKGKPTARSQGHKAKRQQESRAKYLNRPDTDLKDYGAMTDASRETDAKDELDWEIGMLSASTPINATYCQNFDFSGFFTLIEQTYSSMLEVNPRIIKEMPFSVFQHSMVSKLNAVLLDRIKESSQNTNLTEQYAQDLWPDDTLIPQPILDYFSYIANTVCSTGESVVVNIPELAIPQGPIKVDDVERNVDWGESREYEEREGSKKGKPTARSQGHKAKRQQESRAKYLNRPDTDLKDYGAMTDASRETDAKDELDWEIGMLSASTPINATYCQNFDFSGFFTLIEQTYSSMLEVNPRIIKEMPFSVFQHSMVSKLNAVLLDRIKESSQNTNLTEQYAQDLWPDDTLIPQPILDYFSYIANTVCSTGESVVVNIPELAIPQGPIKVDDVEVCPSGSFGYVNANTHNVYECYASPLVTSRMVINEFRVAGQPELPPLPPYIAPAEPSTSSSTPPAGLITRYGRRVRFPARLLSVVTGEGVCGCG
ncbi:hypothetical protein O3M35_011964 [Rhynocoris fuscipes]|uniref:Uncharacterized protein n=1 Tax=Rhynocoris fuscipes TaxID=488301 RepID=A0AAW1CY24_9HEMI